MIKTPEYCFFCLVASVCIVVTVSCSRMTANFKADERGTPWTNIPRATVESYSEANPFSINNERLGGTLMYSELRNVYTTDRALADLQQAVGQYRAYLAEKGGKDWGVSKIDYSPYFLDRGRRYYFGGTKYSDFLSNVVRRFCKKEGIPIGKKSEPLPIEGIARLRDSIRHKRLQYAQALYRNLTDTAFSPSAFSKQYKDHCGAKLTDAIKENRYNFFNDPHLGRWRLFWAGAPSLAKGCGFEITDAGSDWIKMTPLNHDCEPVYLQIVFYGYKLMPGIIGIKNAVYDVSITRDI